MANLEGRSSTRRYYETTYAPERPDLPGAGDSIRPAFQTIISEFAPQPGARLLDIGCWDGWLAQQVAQHLGTADICGVDINAAAVKRARARGMAAQVCDLNEERLPSPDASFDAILCSEVLEHVFAPDDVLLEIRRVLKPSGYAVLTTPNLASWRNRIALLLGWQPFWSEVSSKHILGNPLASGKPNGHLRLMTPRALRELVASCGLTVEHFGGIVYPFNAAEASVVSRAAHAVDGVLGARVPDLCDGMIVRVRRT